MADEAGQQRPRRDGLGTTSASSRTRCRATAPSTAATSTSSAARLGAGRAASPSPTTSKREVGGNLWLYLGGFSFFGQYVDQKLAGLPRTGPGGRGRPGSFDLPLVWAVARPPALPLDRAGRALLEARQRLHATSPLTPAPSFAWDWTKIDAGLRLGIFPGVDLTVEYADNRFILANGATRKNNEFLATLRVEDVRRCDARMDRARGCRAGSKTRRLGSLLALARSSSSPAAAQAEDLHGHIQLLAKGRQGAGAGERRAAGGRLLRAGEPGGGEAAPAEPFEMVTRRKEFEPRVLVIPRGSRVRFPNEDPILHNVFSVSAPNQFDLGLYKGAPGKEKRFDAARPGARLLQRPPRHGRLHPRARHPVSTPRRTPTASSPSWGCRAGRGS